MELSKKEQDLMLRALGFLRKAMACSEEQEDLENEKALASMMVSVKEAPTYESTSRYQIASFKEDKQLMVMLHRDLLAALKPIDRKYGVRITGGTLRYEDKGFGLRLQCVIPAGSMEQLVAGLREGDQFKRKGTIFTVTSIDHQTKKVSAITERRKRYLVRFDQLMQMIKVERFAGGAMAFKELQTFVNVSEATRDVDQLDFANLPVGDGNGEIVVDEPLKKKLLINGKLWNVDDIEVI
jgi:hypothetical protein